MSESSARTTIAVTQSATVTSRSHGAARGAREEDDAIGGARDLVKGANELGLASAHLARERDGRPHALIELAAELLHQALGVLDDVWVALGDQLLAVPRAHAQELHRRRLWQRGTGRPAPRKASVPARGQRADVHGTGPGAETADAVPDSLAGDPFGGAGGLQRRGAERQVGG